MDWIKVKYRNNIWPQIKAGQDIDYLYAKPPIKGPLNFLIPQETRIGGPPSDDPATLLENESAGWGIKIYSDLDGPFITVEGESKSIKKGQKSLAYNSDKTQSLFAYYKVYYMEYTAKSIDKVLAGNPARNEPPIPPTYIDESGNTINLRQSTLDDLNSRLSDFGEQGNIPVQLEGVLENNFMSQSVKPGNTVGLPNFTYKDGKYVRETSNGEIEFPAYAFKVKKNNSGVWMDPEAEYDMKIIKCDAIREITFRNSVGEPENKAFIKRFIKKNLTLNVLNNRKLGFFIPLGLS